MEITKRTDTPDRVVIDLEQRAGVDHVVEDTEIESTEVSTIIEADHLDLDPRIGIFVFWRIKIL